MSTYNTYHAASFLEFLRQNKINNPTVTFIRSGGGGLYEFCIPEFEIVHPTKDLISASGHSLDNCLQELAKKIAGKKIAKITTCPPPHISPEPIEIPVEFGRTEKDIVRT